MSMTVTVLRLVEETASTLSLTCVAGRRGITREISVPRVQKPGLALAGFHRLVHPERVQVIGNTETSYLATLSPEARWSGVEGLCALMPACVVVMRALAVPPELAEAGERHGVSVLTSPLMSSVCIDRLQKYLEDQLAQVTSVHGVLVDVLGVGILLLGKSGIGKSEAALDLVVRGHRLVADDIVDIRKKPPDTIFGRGSDIIRHHMEIRGLGIINIKDLFGISAVRDTKKIQLVVELVEWDPKQEYDRLGLDDLSFRVFDIEVPMLRVPVRSGRSISSIIEVAARNQLLKFQGHHSARDFQDRLNRAIAESRPGSLGPVGDEVE